MHRLRHQCNTLHCCFSFRAKILNLYLSFILGMGSVEICFANTFSPNRTCSCVGFLPCNLSHGVFPSRPFLTSGQDASCMFHQPRQNWPVVPECFLCAASSVTFDGSDDSTHQHHCVIDEPVRLLVTFHCILWGDLCFFTFSATRFPSATISVCVSLFNAVSRYPSQSKIFDTLSLVHNATTPK